jgi:hypothetical protein
MGEVGDNSATPKVSRKSTQGSKLVSCFPEIIPGVGGDYSATPKVSRKILRAQN